MRNDITGENDMYRDRLHKLSGRMIQIQESITEYTDALKNRESDDPVTNEQYQRWIIEEQGHLIEVQELYIMFLSAQHNEENHVRK
jgi:hypothetical protein